MGFINIYNTDPSVVKALKFIIKKLSSMPTKEEFQAAFAELGGSLTNISEDITRLTDSLQSGELTAEEETEVYNQLRGIADQAKAIADRTAEAGAPEGSEPDGGEAQA